VLLSLLTWLSTSVPPLHAQTEETDLAALLQALLTTRVPLPDGEHWIVADARQSDDYAIAVFYRSKTGQNRPVSGQIVLARHDGTGWQETLPNDASYTALLKRMPDSLLDADERAWALAAGTSTLAASTVPLPGYRLPWPAGQHAYVTQNYADHGIGQIDFWLLGDDVVAAKDGEIVYINDSHTAHGCSIDFARYNNVVVIRHAPAEYTIYAHVAAGSVPAWIRNTYAAQGAVPVTQGTSIARQGNSGFTCGGDGIHLHVSTTAGYSVWSAPDSQDEDGDGNRTELVQTAWGSPHQAVDFTEAPYTVLATWPYGLLLTSQNSDRSCQSAEHGGVTLFSAAGCHGDALAWHAATALTNLPDRGWNDRSVSLAVTPGWSVRVFEHIDGAGASRCIGATLPDLAGEYFDDSTTSLADQISSLAVYQGVSCEPLPAIVDVEGVPASLTLAAGANQIVTVTLRTTSTVNLHFNARSLHLTTSAGSGIPEFVAPARFTDIALSANGDLEWVDELSIPADAVAQAWRQGFTTVSATLQYTGSDTLGRPTRAAATWPLDLAACGRANEWNDTGSHATPLTADSSVSGRLCPVGDRDFYLIDGSAGQTIWAALEAAPDTIDPVLSLYAPDTTIPLLTVDDSLDSLNPLLSYTLPAAGQYRLAVSAHEPAPGDPTAPYTLTVSNDPLTLSPCTVAASSSEPDNTPNQARTITVDGTPFHGNRHTADDRDWFTFSTAAGVTYIVEISGKTPARASLFAAEPITPLATISATPAVTASGILTWTAPSKGIHFMEVRGSDANCTATYTLQITAQDSTPPTIDLSIPGNGYTNTTSVEMTVATNDTGSGVDAWRSAGTAAFAGISWAAVPTQTIWHLPAGDGIKTIYAQARDPRGNLSSVVTATITLDTVIPEIALAHDELLLSSPVVNLPLILTPDIAVVRWRIAEDIWNEWKIPDTPFTITLPDRGGDYHIEIQAQDKAGNLSAIRNIAVTVVPPVLFLPHISAP